MPHTTEPLAPDHNTMPDCVVIGDFYELSRKYLRLNDISGGKMLEIGGSVARNGMKQFPEFDYLNVDLLDNDEIHTLVADITDCKDTIERHSIFPMSGFSDLSHPIASFFAFPPKRTMLLQSMPDVHCQRRWRTADVKSLRPATPTAATITSNGWTITS
jgi:hypothetical protein